jgi:AcrR family transcriptional regulator
MKRRPRRTADEAKSAILEAAARRLVESGPDALRLQEIAEEAGISHPAILHHFGSREGLLQAVVEHVTHQLHEDLIRRLAEPSPDGALMFERVAQTLSTEGHARIIGWLLLGGHDPFDAPILRDGFRAIAEFLHQQRVEHAAGKNVPTYEDTVFTIALSAFALFGHALSGESTFKMAGLPTTRALDRRFREWFAAMLTAHLQGTS